jgi:hypothetical protein
LNKVGDAITMINNNNNNISNKKLLMIEFGIFDEAHKMEGIGKECSYGLYDNNVPIWYRLFLTATPRNYINNPKRISILPATKQRSNDGGRQIILTTTPSTKTTTATNNITQQPLEQQQDMVRSFLNEELFGPCLIRRTQRQSVEQNITVPIKLIVMDKKEINTILAEEEEEEEEEESSTSTTNENNNNNNKINIIASSSVVDSNMKYDSLVAFAIQATFHKYNVKHAISFNSRNSRARMFAEAYRKVLTTTTTTSNNTIDDDSSISVFNIDGTMNARRRSEILQNAKDSSKSIITNCQLLGEGVDEKIWDLVIMADGTSSPIDSRQRIGRVSRKAPGKKCGYVLIPMALMDGEYSVYDYDENDDDDDDFDDDDDDDNNNVNSSRRSYNNFITTFQAMVSEDPELKQDVLFVVDKMSELGRPLESTEFPERFLNSFELPSAWSYKLKTDMMNSVVVEFKRGSKWERMYKLLLMYKKKEGNCNVPQNHKEDGENLGQWLDRQRYNKKKGRLDTKKEQQLNAIGVTWDVLSQKWEDNFNLLLQYKVREGDCNVPAIHKEDGENLGQWLNNQRTYKKNGKLDTEKEKRLEEIGVTWDVLSQQWEDNFTLLLQYKEREGDCNVPGRHKEDGENLGIWLKKQRQNKKKGRLHTEKEQQLNAIGVVLDPYSIRWETMFTLLEQYKEREGDCNVPAIHKEDGENLGYWLSQRRYNKKKGKLDKERIRRLEEIGAVWSMRS